MKRKAKKRKERKRNGNNEGFNDETSDITLKVTTLGPPVLIKPWWICILAVANAKKDTTSTTTTATEQMLYFLRTSVFSEPWQKFQKRAFCELLFPRYRLSPGWALCPCPTIGIYQLERERQATNNATLALIRFSAPTTVFFQRDRDKKRKQVKLEPGLAKRGLAGTMWWASSSQMAFFVSCRNWVLLYKWSNERKRDYQTFPMISRGGQS